MKKIVSILAIAITVPALATDITGSSDCDNSTLGTYSAPVDMEAKWTANTINLQWYDDANDSTPTSTTCQYSSTIALPTEPSKPGYNFTGWQLRPQPFDLSTLNANTDAIYYVSKNFSSGRCEYYNLQTDDEIESYTCTESAFTSLNPGEWEATFDYGTVKGITLCSSTKGTYANTGTPDETGTGRYIWCKVTGFAEPNSSTYTKVVSSAWFFKNDQATGYDCRNVGPHNCVNHLSRASDFRRAVYGITQ